MFGIGIDVRRSTLGIDVRDRQLGSTFGIDIENFGVFFTFWRHCIETPLNIAKNYETLLCAMNLFKAAKAGRCGRAVIFKISMQNHSEIFMVWCLPQADTSLFGLPPPQVVV